MWCHVRSLHNRQAIKYTWPDTFLIILWISEDPGTWLWVWHSSSSACKKTNRWPKLWTGSCYGKFYLQHCSYLALTAYQKLNTYSPMAFILTTKCPTSPSARSLFSQSSRLIHPQNHMYPSNCCVSLVSAPFVLPSLESSSRWSSSLTVIIRCRYASQSRRSSGLSHWNL